MLNVHDRATLSRALNSSLDPRLKQLLAERVRQLDVEDLSTAARFVLVQPSDTLADLERAFGFSILQNPADGTRFGDPDFSPGFEWIEDHGFAFELVFIFTDDGFAHVVLAARHQGINADLLKFCEACAGEHAVS